MTITGVNIDKYTPKEKGICASATVYFDNELVIHQIHVISGDGGLFVAFPNNGKVIKSKGTKRYKDIAHPCTDDLRVKIKEAVINEYEKLCSNM